MANLNKSLADELNQPTSFPTAGSNKKIQKPNKAQNPVKPQNPMGWTFFKTWVFLNPEQVIAVWHLAGDCYRLSKIVVPPRIVREMSWVCNYWPENMPYPYTSSDRSTLSALDRPEIQRYCLMSVKDSFTDFHIDFGGTSVWYHILRVSVVVRCTSYWQLKWLEYVLCMRNVVPYCILQKF